MRLYIEDYWDSDNEDLKPGWKSLVFFDKIEKGIRAKVPSTNGTFYVAIGQTKEFALSNLRAIIRYGNW